MAKTVELTVNLIGKTRIEPDAMMQALEEMGVSLETARQLVYSDCTDAEKLVAFAAKQCYMSFEVGLNPNVTKVRSDMVEYLDNVMAQKHGSVLEHVSWNFSINGVSRVFTGEMNRHRVGVAISERSMRYIRFNQSVDYWLPTSLQNAFGDDADITNRKSRTRFVFQRAFKQMEDNYRELCDIWDMDADNANFSFKKTMTSCFRRIIGMGCATGGVWTMNCRALRHVLTMRCSKAAEEEILLVASMMLNKMRESEPILFGDFTPEGVPKYDKV